MAVLGLLLLLLLFLQQPEWIESKDDRAVILSAMEKATVFMKKRHRELNLDGVLGFRILEAQLKGVEDKWDLNPAMQSLKLRTEKISTKLSSLITSAIYFLELQDSNYLKKFNQTLQSGFWKLSHSWDHTNITTVDNYLKKSDSFSEELSDSCMSFLLGTWQEDGKPCIVTDTCRDLMTQPGTQGYMLSHQLLYFMLAEMKGCSDDLFLSGQYYKNNLCANMMKVNLAIENAGFQVPDRDLFMENIMFCGICGFSDFYKPHWLEIILTWQRPEGCFGKPHMNSSPITTVGRNEQQFLRRVKRRDKGFADGCSSHNTAVAVGALGGFLYHLADPSHAGTEPSESFTPSGQQLKRSSTA
ncbi:UPF0764 protein C16orf89 homolog [Ornithorhynchus anatinus]|uniref:Chromosome 16 open reading frame 89 n=1 Tax=Ornithorhynchus anatinus TaxID=9258 RepID=F7CBD8_ORNAN|nr:UPF0764 protein C16orf89 homolog [Ornithorhynchus anatinus]